MIFISWGNLDLPSDSIVFSYPFVREDQNPAAYCSRLSLRRGPDPIAHGSNSGYDSDELGPPPSFLCFFFRARLWMAENMKNLEGKSTLIIHEPPV